MGVRVTYRRRTSYNTRSNKIRKVKTPGGNVVVQYPNKKTSASTCADSNLNVVLNGLKRIRPTKLKQLARRQRTVSRPYGGVLSAGALKTEQLEHFWLRKSKLSNKSKMIHIVLCFSTLNTQIHDLRDICSVFFI